MIELNTCNLTLYTLSAHSTFALDCELNLCIYRLDFNTLSKKSQKSY